MVDHTIRASAWAHNCGMHVVADYLVEQIKKDNFQTVFTGTPYDALLNQFRAIYQQDNLSWGALQRSTNRVTRTDSQIIWGFALRKMMPSVFQNNIQYKQDLYIHFSAAIALFKNKQLNDVKTTYPIIFEANRDYFESKLLLRHNQQENLDYWNRTGFNKYCSTISTFNEVSQTFLWLSSEELTLFCRYFNIESVMVDHTRVKEEYNPNKIFFSNPTRSHWERKIRSAEAVPIVTPEATPEAKPASTPVLASEFQKMLTTIGSSIFTTRAKAIGELLFSDFRLEPKLWLDYCHLPQIDDLKKCIINNDEKGFADFIKKNQVNNNEYNDLMAFMGAYHNQNGLNTWLKSPEINAFSIPYDKILLSTVKYQKQLKFDLLLANFRDKLTANNCMPALLCAAKHNYASMAFRILALPFFDQPTRINKALSYITPANFHPLNQTDKNGIPALYYAIKNKNRDLVNELLTKGACATYNLGSQQLDILDIPYKKSFLPVTFDGYRIALELEAIEISLLLLPAPNILDETMVPFPVVTMIFNSAGNNLFHLCAANGKILLTQNIYNLHPRLDSLNKAGKNCLHLCAEIGDIKGIDFCLKNKVSLFSKDSNGNTALHLALENNHVGTATHLITKILNYNNSAYFPYQKYDLAQKNKNNQSALDIAYDNNLFPIITYFKQNGFRNLIQELYTELNKAIRENNNNFDEIITRNNKAIGLTDSKGNTILHYVCCLIHNEHTATIIGLLTKHGQNVNALNNEGQSSLHLAANKNNVNAIRILLDRKAFIDIMDQNGVTPAHMAAISNSNEALEVLKNSSASLDIKAFPSAISKLPFSWDSNNPLTVRNIIEVKNGQAKKPFKSIKHRAINFIEDKLNFTNHPISNLYSEIDELEQKKTYQRLGMLKIGITVAGAAYFGPYFIPIELARQGCLYATPTIKNQAGQLYYRIKPGIHNYTLPCISQAFDYGSTGISYAYEGAFGLMTLNDWYTNFAPRAIGLGTGIGLLKLAQKLGVKNEECQAAVLFLAKEASYVLVDAYNKTSPENKAHNAQAHLSMDKNLDHAYEVWTSVLGKEEGEKLVNVFHFIHQYQEKAYSHLGEMERAILEPIAKNGRDFLEPLGRMGRASLEPFARMGTDFIEQLGTMEKGYREDILEPLYERGKDSLQPLYATGRDSLKPFGRVGTDFLEQLGTMEENYLKQIKGYTEFQKIAGDVTKVITGVVDFTFTPLAMTKLELNNLAETVAECRDRFLIGLNEAIHQNLIPESDYKRVMLNYVTDQKIMLYAHKKQDLETQLKQAIIDENEIKIKSVQSSIDTLEIEITASEKFMKENSEYLSNSKVTNQYNSAMQNQTKAWNNLEELNMLKTLNPESFVDMAYKDLGNDFTGDELNKYMTSMISAYGIFINPDELNSFQSKIDSTQLHNPDFKQSIKSELTTFWKTQVERHIASSNDNFSAEYEKSKIELEASLKDFVGSANPEELRVCALNQKPEILKIKYDINLKHINDNIQKMAFTEARYSAFVHDSLAYEEAERNLLFAETTLNQTEHLCNQEIDALNIERSQLELKLEKMQSIDISKIEEETKNQVKGNEVPGNKREDTRNNMLKWAVETWSITLAEAEPLFKHDFYESLKEIKGESALILIPRALEKAKKTMFDNAKKPLNIIKNNMDEQKQKIEKAKLEVNSKREALSKQKDILNNTKEGVLNKLDPQAKYDFKEYATDLVENISLSNKRNQSLLQKHLAENEFNAILNTKQIEEALLKEQEAQLELLNNFSYTENEMYGVLKEAFELDDYNTKAQPYIIAYLTKKSGLDEAYLNEHFGNSLSPCVRDEKKYARKKVKKSMFEKLKDLTANKIPIQKNLFNNEIKTSNDKLITLTKDLEIPEERLNTATSNVNLAREKYLEKLTPQQKLIFYAQEAANKTQVISTAADPNLPNWYQPAHVIGSVVNEGFAKYSDVNQLAEYLADQIMGFKAQLYEETRDAAGIEQERQLLIHELKNHELKRFDERAHRVKNRLYDYIFAKVHKIEKKTHKHMLSRILKPIANDIFAEFTGRKLFREFHGGEDKKGAIGIQLSFLSNGTTNISLQVNEIPFWTIYQSEPQRRQAETAQPVVFKKNRDTTPKDASAKENEAEEPKKPLMMAPSTYATPTTPSIADKMLNGGVFAQEKPALPAPDRRGALPGYLEPGKQESTKQPSVQKPAGPETVTPKPPVTRPSEPAKPAGTAPTKAPASKASETTKSSAQNQAAAAPLPPLMMAPSAHATPTPIPSIPGISGPLGSQALPAPSDPGAVPAYLTRGNYNTTTQQSATPMAIDKVGKGGGSGAKKTDPQNKRPRTTATPKKPSKPSTPEEKAKAKAGSTSNPSQVPQPAGKANSVKMFSEKGLQAAHSATKANAEAQSQKAFEHFKEETHAFLGACGAKDAVQTNACINNLYSVAGKSMPYLWWPTAAVGGSALIGKSINIAQRSDVILLGKNTNVHAFATGLPIGNSLIAADIIPLLKVYQTEGFAGIKYLEATLIKTYAYSAEKLISAFKQQDVLDRNVDILAKSMKLDRNDPRVVNEFFSNSDNVKISLQISMDLVFHEQTIVQKMYDPQLTSALMDPKNIFMGSLLHLDVININGKKFSFSDYVRDPSNFDQRMNYFRAIFSEIGKVYPDPKKLKDYTDQMDRHRQLANVRTGPHHSVTIDDPLSHREIQLNTKFYTQLNTYAYNFWNNSIIPSSVSKNPKKQAYKGK